MGSEMCIRDRVSRAATRHKCGPGTVDTTLMCLGIKRAFLYGDIERDVYIELPPEDPKSGGNIVGRLLRTMYGTRDAPQGFQQFMHRILGKLGSFRSVISPCVY